MWERASSPAEPEAGGKRNGVVVPVLWQAPVKSTITETHAPHQMSWPVCVVMRVVVASCASLIRPARSAEGGQQEEKAAAMPCLKRRLSLPALVPPVGAFFPFSSSDLDSRVHATTLPLVPMPSTPKGGRNKRSRVMGAPEPRSSTQDQDTPASIRLSLR